VNNGARAVAVGSYLSSCDNRGRRVRKMALQHSPYLQRKVDEPEITSPGGGTISILLANTRGAVAAGDYPVVGCVLSGPVLLPRKTRMAS
jgi:hypothetical protein